MSNSQLEQLYDRFLNSTGVSTDTRKINKGQIFFALKGENFNGNQYAAQAMKSGAIMAVVDEEEFAAEGSLLVDNVLSTLQQLASHHRDHLDIPVLGLTGSNGKTTTKELMQAVLSSALNSFATPGNLNNHIGVPLTLLQINQDHEIAIIELGANHVGEIAMLCDICKPTHGMITNIGKDHLEGFGSFEGSLRANSELYQYLIQNGGTAFVNSRDDTLRNMSKRFSNEVIFYPDHGDYYQCHLNSADPYLVIQAEQGVIHSKMIGSYNFINIASALCVGKYFGIPEYKSVPNLESYSPSNNRSEFVKKGSIAVILDAYNANPSSVEVAIESLRDMHAKRKVIILGDMFELGNYSMDEHKAIGEFAGGNADQVLLCGHEFAAAMEETNLEGVEVFDDKDSLIEYVKSQSWGSSTVLIKGSRGMKMEEVLDYLGE